VLQILFKKFPGVREYHRTQSRMTRGEVSDQLGNQ
jgi:hypothetical protein